MWKEFKSLAPVEADVRETDGFQCWKQQIYQRSSDQDEFELFVNVSHCVISLLLYIPGLIVFLIKIKASPVPTDWQLECAHVVTSRVTANEFPISIVYSGMLKLNG